jgi:RimJ/RimL family protein N-acetyltransferase
VRPLAPADVPAIVAACRDPEIPRWTLVPSPYLREDAERYLAVAASEAAAGDGVALAICEAARDRLIGTIGLMGVDRARGYGEIGYWTAASARRRGAATRAVALVRDWAHAALGLSAIEILAHRDNRPSQLVAERAGFADTGELRSVARMPERIRHGYKVYAWRAAAPEGSVPAARAAAPERSVPAARAPAPAGSVPAAHAAAPDGPGTAPDDSSRAA